MVKETKLPPEECVNLVKTIFSEELQSFELAESSTHAGYWWLKFLNQDKGLKIKFDGDRGGHFTIDIEIDNEEYNLWQYDKTVNSRTLSTKSNILFQCSVLLQFLEDL